MHDNKDKVFEFLKNHHVATLATASQKARPHAATIYYVVDQSLTIYFVTKGGTEKYKQINENDKVALVVTDELALKTVQIEGQAVRIMEPTEIEEVGKNLESVRYSASWTPPLRKLSGKFLFFKVTPTWIRATDFNKWENMVEYEEGTQA